ncbi:MAG: family 10 glycosylhydrolase [Cyanobacteria bacterium P01_A01_bin.83]
MKFIFKTTKRIILLFTIGIVLFLGANKLTYAPHHNPQSSQVIKGVWLSHLGNAFLTYTGVIDNAFNQLSKLNYNRVYVDVYNNGTTYPSKYAPINPIFTLPLTNHLATAIKEGKRQGLKIYAWYEHGMMTFPQAKLAQQHPDWILATKDNQKLIDRHWWLDPENLAVQQYFVNLFTEVATSYPNLDGIQLDDHWGIPIQFGDKAEAMTALTSQVVIAIRKVRPDLIISLSPNPLGFSRRKYGQDWLRWLKSGLIDELVMQLYRPTSAEVELAITNSILSEVSQYVDTAIGIYAGSFQKQKSLAEIQQQIKVAQKYGYGYAIFSWRYSLGILRWASRQEKEHYLKAM